jgi:hypothetical protein
MTRYQGSMTLGDDIDGKEYLTPQRFDQPTLLKGSLYRLLHPCNTIKHKGIIFTYNQNHTFSATNNSIFEKNVQNIEFISLSCSANSNVSQNNAIKINVQNKGKMSLSLSNMQRLTAGGGDKRVSMVILITLNHWCLELYRSTLPLKHFIHLVVCLTTGPRPLPNPALHIVRSSASSFKCESPLLSLRSSSSFLRFLPRLPVTSIPPCIFPSITGCRRQFLRKM